MPMNSYPPLRRSNRSVSDVPGILSILEQCLVLRLGMAGPEGPYVVPLNFGYAAGPQGALTLYFHCAQEGRKVDMLAADPRVCFEADCSHRLVEGEMPCKYTFAYESVIGFGRARQILDPAERLAALRQIMARFSDAPSFAFDQTALSKTNLYAIDVDYVAGKRNGL